MELRGNWSYPTQIRFGAGRITELPGACAEAGMTRPLLVTDKGLAGLPITAQAMEILREGGLEAGIFTETDPNPTGENVASGLKVFRDGGHDGVIAFGGGSALDLGKVLAFMAGQSRPVWDFEDVGDWWTRADAEAILPIIAVPTTAGTGSEVGRAGVITKSDSREKKIIFHPLMLPKIVLADPELTAGMPPAITAGTGMDAFAHCLEAFSSPHYHPMSQGIALEGMRLVKENLPRAFADGQDIEARAHMMSAAMMGAVGFQKGLGAIHSISHPVGAIYHTHHGTTNAAVMRAVLRFNRPAIEERMGAAARYLGVGQSFDDFYRFVEGLIDGLNIPADLTGMGITDPDMEALLRGALADPSCGGNPVKMDEANTRALLEDCF